jgi:PTH1 family peptidyl-tRNA hydrolase
MGLFQRREQPQLEIAYNVSIGSNDTKLLVGLGNPGKQYDNTRHNIGFACLDAFAASENGTWTEKKSLQSHICELRIGQTKIVLCKPQMYMNASGEAVRLVQSYFKLKNNQTIVVHDELDLPFGQIRTRKEGGAAGHNGIKSLITSIGDGATEGFGRVRIGIGNQDSGTLDKAEFVLQKFNKAEQAQMALLIKEVNSILNECIFGDLPTDTRTFL